jgi:hypothetical protein
MKFGQLIDGKIKYAQSPIEYGGRTYFTSDPKVMLSLGYKEIVDTITPTSENGIYKPQWVETDTQIIQKWLFEEYTEEQLKEQYKELTVRYIRKKYSSNQEFAILREYMSDSTNKNAFEEYNLYVESCKAKAYADIYNKSTVKDSEVSK